ncbi:SDR family oxidoreductase [Streptomyces cocklensis]|jgi:3-oxoacyl-[acyl-carrier protein] reductase|uniref:Cyclic-di-GMP-binding biofilm dispersal mediator protein n=1 Tax=Actinacidiphila cocklensis TaxID=887465 RepID=A0A9W4DJ02_9ACTN|nr:SDR family oxidoreductase [Actinacidiphila cocklensis]MDD1063591.1 SDR family oxidoreductase [Actinacidiphila cocklensis]WSX72973.1 SDR family oxidoreductase [Streptomyces sp. NBC_00899]WSX80960.1 SDR family oxidoreductase [Streptomyces sp. NBC_00899]CAG6390992.1 Cyclic-di-GMP-binding biofilm dispersal mediator protein [Actinacidiphila cocklensis]
MDTLTGRTALVTGGSRGIGAAVALRLAQEGAAVALTYVNSADKAEAVAGKIVADGGRALAVRADAADPEAPADAVERTVRELGGIDILVNNAGIFIGGTLEDHTVDELDRILAVNIRAVFLASQAAARHMPEGGRIVTIGSALTDHVPAPGLTLYSMSKAALTGLTRGLARDLAPRGINASVVHAGLVDTEMNPADGPAAEFMRQIPALGRYGAAAEVADAVAFLAGNGGRYITGSVLTVDGGFSA